MGVATVVMVGAAAGVLLVALFDVGGADTDRLATVKLDVPLCGVEVEAVRLGEEIGGGCSDEGDGWGFGAVVVGVMPGVVTFEEKDCEEEGVVGVSEGRAD